MTPTRTTKRSTKKATTKRATKKNPSPTKRTTKKRAQPVASELSPLDTFERLVIHANVIRVHHRAASPIAPSPGTSRLAETFLTFPSEGRFELRRSRVELAFNQFVETGELVNVSPWGDVLSLMRDIDLSSVEAASDTEWVLTITTSPVTYLVTLFTATPFLTTPFLTKYT